MSDVTQKLGLVKPVEGSFGWNTHIDDNFDKLDNHPGVKVCTSETMPESPWTGQIVYISDLEAFGFWDGSEWKPLAAEPPAPVPDIHKFDFSLNGTLQNTPGILAFTHHRDGLSLSHNGDKLISSQPHFRRLHPNKPEQGLLLHGPAGPNIFDDWAFHFSMGNFHSSGSTATWVNYGGHIYPECSEIEWTVVDPDSFYRFWQPISFFGYTPTTFGFALRGEAGESMDIVLTYYPSETIAVSDTIVLTENWRFIHFALPDPGDDTEIRWALLNPSSLYTFYVDSFYLSELPSPWPTLEENISQCQAQIHTNLPVETQEFGLGFTWAFPTYMAYDDGGGLLYLPLSADPLEFSAGQYEFIHIRTRVPWAQIRVVFRYAGSEEWLDFDFAHPMPDLYCIYIHDDGEGLITVYLKAAGWDLIVKTLDYDKEHHLVKNAIIGRPDPGSSTAIIAGRLIVEEDPEKIDPHEYLAFMDGLS